MNDKYSYDASSDSLYIWLKEGEEEDFEEIVPGVNVELDSEKDIIGIEILHVSRLLPKTKREKSASPTPFRSISRVREKREKYSS